MKTTDFSSVKGIAAPARRALSAAGYTHLEQLTNVSEKELSAMHGVGPNGIKALKLALAEKSLSLRD